MIRKPILITTLIGQNKHSASIDTGTYQLVDGVASNTILEALDASVQLSIDGASSSASIRLETGTKVDIRAFVEMFTIQGSAGIFRTRSPQVGYGSNSTTIQLEHAINEMGDFIIADTFEKEMTLENALKKVFSYYSAKSNLWKLGKVAKPQDPDSDEETAEKCVLSVDYNNCLEALQGIMEQYPYMMLQFDFAKTPWVLNVLNKPTIDEAQGRLSRNVKNATVTRDDSEMYNRVYAQKKNGKYGKYDAAGYWKNKYGLIETVISGANDTDAIWSKTVKSYIKNHKKPKYSITIEGIELSSITGEALDKLTLGKRMCLALPDYNTTVSELITGVSFSSIYKNPTSCTITLNTEEDKVIKYIKKAQKEAGKASKSASAARSAAFVDAKVENNILTITKGDGSSVNFSKAVSLTKTWGSGTFTVKANQTNKNTSTGKNETVTVATATTKLYGIELQKDKSPSRSGTYNLFLPLKVTYETGNPKSPKSDTGFTAGITVSAKTVYDKGASDGWGKAFKNVVYPTSSTSEHFFYMKTPAKTINAQTQTTFNLSSYNNNNVDCSIWDGSKWVTVARLEHGKYTAGRDKGWDDAFKKVVYPTSNTSEHSFYMKTPAETVNGQTQTTFNLVSHNNNNVDCRIWDGSSWVTVARLEHGKYTAGWEAAYGEVSIPKKNESSAKMTVKVPGSSSGTQSTYEYTVSVSGNNADIKNASGTTVARTSISSVTPTVTKKLVENTSTSPSYPNATFITGLGSVGANKRVYITVGGTRVTSTIFYLTT